MSQFLPFVVIGITTGAIYGLAGTGLVLTYKTSGIFNFAYGSVATLAVFVFYFLHVQHAMAWPLAALLSVGVMGPIEGLLLERLARALDPMSPTLKVVATVGLLLAVLGLGTIWYGSEAVDFPQFLPAETFRLVGVNVQWSQLIVTVVSVLATGILYYFFRFVRLGVSMRGVVDNPDLVSMTGQSPAMVRRWAWVIGSVFASLAGLLLAPNLTLSALTLTMLVVQAFGAAAVGYFSNLPLTFVGGLVIGIPAALATKYVVSVSWLSGLPVGLPFILLFIVLIVTPRAKLMERRLVPPMPIRVRWQAPAPARVGFGVLILAAAALVPTFAGANLSVWSTFLVDVMLFLSLGLLVRKSGQISLCHLAFAAIGAASFGHFTSDWHIPWLASLALAGLVAIPVGALIAIPAIRLSGVFLAVATFGFGILLQQVLYTTGLMFGPTSAGIAAPRPDVDIAGWNLGSNTGFYYLLLVFAVLTVATVLALQHGRMGRLLGGLADSPSALETHGAATAVTRVLLFCITAAMASIAGALLSSLFSYASGSNFDPFTSLTMVAIIVIVLGADPWYAIMASLGFAVFPGYVTVGNVGSYLQIAFGFSAMIYAMRGGKAPTVPVPLQRLIERLGTLSAPLDHRRAPALLLAAGDGALVPVPAGAVSQPAMAGATVVGAVAAVAAEVKGGSSTAPGDRSLSRRWPPVEHPAPEGGDGPALEVRGLSVRFGGVQAVDDVGLSVPFGTVTGLVGPNGAGKTTIFNACSGLVRPSAGTVLLHGTAVNRLGPAGRARRGLGRTFQRVDLFNSLSVARNVELGREASMAGRNPLAHVVSSGHDRTEVSEAARQAMALTGIEELAGLQAGLLSTGQRRMVEFARALAGPFDVLLLDEPSSGLDAAETQWFGQVLRKVIETRHVAVLLVEHDMALVRQVCEHVYVLDFGRLIFEGSFEEMRGSEAVRAAYLGAGA